MRKLIALLTIFSFNAYAVAPSGVGGEQGTLNYTNNIKAPNYQVTSLGGVNSRMETGNTNLLMNPSFEHPTVGTGWTTTNATASADITNQVDGKKALSLSVTGAMLVSQDSTINAANISGLQGVASVKIKATGTTGLKVCPRTAGSAVSGLCVNVTADNTWKHVLIPFILGITSNGIGIATTATGGTVIVDDAFVGTSAPFQNVNSESVFSAKIAADGTVSDESSDFISGNASITNTSTYALTFNSGVFTVAPNCVVLAKSTATDGYNITNYTRQNTTSTSFTYRTTNGATAVAQTSAVDLICQKQGKDMPLASKIYSQSSQDTGWVPCTFSTLAWQGFGTVTNNLFCSRKGANLEMRGIVTIGTVAASLAQFPLPNNWGSITTGSTSSAESYGMILRNVASNNSLTNAISTIGLGYFQVSNSLTTSAANPATAVNGNVPFTSSDVLEFVNIKIPISGWSDYGVIVGSFAGIEKCANDYECTDTFSAQVTTTSGAIANQNISWLSCTAANPTVCTYNSGLKDGINSLSSAMNCNATLAQNANVDAIITASTSSSVTVNTINSATGALVGSMSFALKCQKGSQDYKPKTAKVASSIGVPTVPGLTGSSAVSVDTFSFSYGGATATTVCSATPCTIYNQIGTAVTSVGWAVGPIFTANLTKTYSNINCVVQPFASTTNALATTTARGSSVSSVSWSSTVHSSGSGVNTYGTVICQGTY